MKILFGTAAGISILAAVTIFIFLFYKGIPALSTIGLGNFLFGENWMPNVNDTIGGEISGRYGIFPMIVGTLYATVGAVIIGGTLGYFIAVFISRFCPKRLKQL
ncbi:MAG: phosphate ABC transporter permease subunit PstC, partial [Clostridia bacterium]